MKKHNAEKFFSPEEAAFIKNTNPTRADRIKFSWRYECYWVCLWSLGYVEELSRPEGVCDVTKAVGIIAGKTTEEFIKDAKLRPLTEILDQTDLTYRYHWACVDARINKKDAPAKLNKGVVNVTTCSTGSWVTWMKNGMMYPQIPRS